MPANGKKQVIKTIKEYLIDNLASQNVTTNMNEVSIINKITGMELKMKDAGQYFSEALILASTNPQYDKRLSIELGVQYIKTTSSEHVVYKNCFLFLFWHSEQFMYTTSSELAIFMYWTCNSMNNLLLYCGLVDARITASEKDLPVLLKFWKKIYQ